MSGFYSFPILFPYKEKSELYIGSPERLICVRINLYDQQQISRMFPPSAKLLVKSSKLSETKEKLSSPICKQSLNVE